MDWQLIEKEMRGVRCLIATPKGKWYKVRMLNGYLIPPNKAVDNQSGETFATHWRPLPDPPPLEDAT